METVDCIVVGGGLAGLSAAYGLAGAGVEVMVLERGNFAGAKNVTGGRLYTSVLRDVYPELWEEAAADGGPFERPVTRELITLLGDGAATTVELAGDRAAAPSPQSHTVQRAKLDRWLADKVTEKGGLVVCDMKADELLVDDGRVIGVRAGGDEVGAEVTIVAEGVLGLLASGAGLREQPRAADNAVGFKEVIELPAATIEDRFHLDEDEGAAQLFMGRVTRGMTGGGFLYTNRDSLALGVVVSMEQMQARGDELESWQLLDEFKALPAVAPLVRGGEVAEYSAHAVAEGGLARLPRLYGDGYLLAGEAAGLSLNALVTVRGMDFALASGRQAARAVLAARARGDSSAAALSVYEDFLRETFVLRDLEAYRRVPQVIENRRLFDTYPDAAARLLSDLFTVGPQGSSSLLRTGARGARREFLKLDTLRDLWSLRRLW